MNSPSLLLPCFFFLWASNGYRSEWFNHLSIWILIASFGSTTIYYFYWVIMSSDTMHRFILLWTTLWHYLPRKKLCQKRSMPFENPWKLQGGDTLWLFGGGVGGDKLYQKKDIFGSKRVNISQIIKEHCKLGKTYHRTAIFKYMKIYFQMENRAR